MSRVFGKLIRATILVVSAFGSSTSSAQILSPEKNSQPVDNSQFYGVPIHVRVSRVFEIYDPHSMADLRDIQSMGFDQVILDQPQWHQAATELGLKVVLANWWTKDTREEEIDSALRLAATVKPGFLAGISVMDEPERNAPDTPFRFYVDLYRRLTPRLKKELPGVPLEISYWGPLGTWAQPQYGLFSFLYNAADRMRLMPYPDLQEEPLEEVFLMMARSKLAMKQAQVDIPQVVILQTWVLPEQGKLPTIHELRVMAYQAMLGGAETVSFFEYKPEVWARTPGYAEDFRSLMRELVGLRQRLTGALLETSLLDNGILNCTASLQNGDKASIQVNTNRFEMEGFKGLEIRDESKKWATAASNPLRSAAVLDQSSLAIDSHIASPTISHCPVANRNTQARGHQPIRRLVQRLGCAPNVNTRAGK